MTEEEKAAAALAATASTDEPTVPAIEADPVAEANARAEKAEKERDNYKVVALKRLGKLPNDAHFLSGNEDTTELTVQDQIKIALLEEEVKRAMNEKEVAYKKVLRERDEAVLALKNRPPVSIGGDSTSNVTVKDNVLSDGQIEKLTAEATRLKVDPDKFIQNFKQNLLKKG